MAVFTPITMEQVDELLLTYNVGRVHTLHAIETGVENTNYKVETDQGPFILTLFEGRTDVTSLPFFFAFMRHLNNAGITCPAVVHAQNGAEVSKLLGKPVALMTFLDGTGVTRADITPALAAQMGNLVARMHVAVAKGFNRVRGNSTSVTYWQAMIDKCRARADMNTMAVLEPEMDYLHGVWHDFVTLPRGIIHADLFPDNVFIKDEKIYGVIDFYFACTDTYVYDLAIAFNAWCFDENHQYNEALGAVFMMAYQAVRPLSADEKKMFQAAARAACVRFLTSRLHDKIYHPQGAQVTPKDPDEYLKKLMFHQKEMIEL